MKNPRFGLTRIYEDGTREPLRIVPVTALPWETRQIGAVFLARR